MSEREHRLSKDEFVRMLEHDPGKDYVERIFKARYQHLRCLKNLMNAFRDGSRDATTTLTIGMCMFDLLIARAYARRAGQWDDAAIIDTAIKLEEIEIADQIDSASWRFSKKLQERLNTESARKQFDEMFSRLAVPKKWEYPSEVL